VFSDYRTYRADADPKLPRQLTLWDASGVQFSNLDFLLFGLLQAILLHFIGVVALHIALPRRAIALVRGRVI
jgi:hypothetical protein